MQMESDVRPAQHSPALRYTALPDGLLVLHHPPSSKLFDDAVKTFYDLNIVGVITLRITKCVTKLIRPANLCIIVEIKAKLLQVVFGDA